jgi:hypothetical protein
LRSPKLGAHGLIVHLVVDDLDIETVDTQTV